MLGPAAPDPLQWREPRTSTRPWSDDDAPASEQAVRYEYTQRAVAHALAKAGLQEAAKKARKGVGKEALHLAGDILHDVLEVTADVLDFVPIPAVGKVAGILVKIWDATQEVEVNRMACLRLTGHAANILLAMCIEIKAGGSAVEEALTTPLKTLAETFEELFALVDKQAHRPFLKRYLNRDEDLKAIKACNLSLSLAMVQFNNSGTLSVLKRVLSLHEMLEKLVEANTLRSPEPAFRYASGPSTPGAGSSALGLTFSPTSPQSPPTPRAAACSTEYFDHLQTSASAQLYELDSARAKIHAAMDQTDMHDRMREALRDGSDDALFKLLQVPRHELPEAQMALRRALEAISSDPRTTSDEAAQFHLEFLESGVEALHRLSDYRAVPAYVVTKYEIDRGSEIVGSGNFARVYKGTWRSQTIAIKVLLPETPITSFKREVEIWRRLKHRHVLPLWATSSPDAGPPFFCVSPYMPKGALPDFLRNNPDTVEHIRFIHEVAMGMEYLHSKEVIHGDMKAANVLVDHRTHCVIADFGQSDIRSDIARLSAPLPPGEGTMRWAAPEIASGEGALTKAVDVYAFAVCCCEILKNGDKPWPRATDGMIPAFLAEGRRPSLPMTAEAIKLGPYMKSWWSTEPELRPAFTTITAELETLRGLDPGWDLQYDHDSPKPPTAPVLSSVFSPSPQPRTDLPDETDSFVDAASIDSDSYHSAISNESGSGTVKSDVTKSTYYSSYLDRPPSPRPTDKVLSYKRDERRYRTRLQHNFHESLRLPLWTPVKVELGAVGYMDTANRGTFITLFNAFRPGQSFNGIVRYSSLSAHIGQRLDKVNPPAARQRSASFARLLRSKAPEPEVSFRLHRGHKQAFLFTESTLYKYMESLDSAKAWFAGNIDLILQQYGRARKLQREDILLVVGTLNAAEWASFVSHWSNGATIYLKKSPYADRRPMNDWAEFSQGTPDPGTDTKWKVSKWMPAKLEQDWDSVLLARLCFKPDRDGPTSGP